MDRVTVPEAAQLLGISQDAVRQRIRRNSMEHEKDENGRVYVYIDPTHTQHDNVQEETPGPVHDTSVNALLESQQDQINFLRAELERKDTIIMSLTQRIPELEPSPEPPETPQAASEEPSGTQTPQEETERSRGFWRRLFGG
jgi:hypothetical protein